MLITVTYCEEFVNLKVLDHAIEVKGLSITVSYSRLVLLVVLARLLKCFHLLSRYQIKNCHL